MAASADLNLQMWKAAENNDVETVKSCLMKKADPNFMNDAVWFEKTALHICAEKNHEEVAALLLQHGADVDVMDNSQYTPLRYSAIKDSTKVAALLIDKGADVENTTDGNNRPLHWAPLYSSSVTKLLVEHGADVNVPDEDQWTPLHCCCKQNGNVESARIILECQRFTALHAKNEDGMTALDVAREEAKNPNLIKLLEDAEKSP